MAEPPAMPPNSSPDLSLRATLQHRVGLTYDLTITAGGLQDLLSSLVNFLASQRVATHLWVKLPSQESWWADLRRYHQGLGGDYPLLRFRTAAPDPCPPPAPGELTLPLADPQLWSQDYFVILQGEQFASLVLATPLGQVGEAGLEPTTPMAACHSVSPLVCATVLGTLQDHIRQMTDPAALLPAGIKTLQCPAPLAASSPPGLTLVDRWLAWHLQRQQDCQQSLSTYQQASLGLSTLSSENEILLNSLRLKDEFLNAMGQELRTPLTTIKTALTLLDSPQIKGPQRQRYLHMISHECDRQSALIHGVLNLLQMETQVSQGSRVPVYLADTIPPLVSTYQPLAAEKGIMLAYTIPEHLAAVACPDHWLRQMVIHLVNNSLKYTHRGGQVWVTARQRDKTVELEVRDTGVGIAPSDLPHIFDYFYRGRHPTLETTEGSGMGLAIVQQLLLFCNGSVRVSSEVDRGTQFLLQIPIQPSSPDQPNHRPG